VFEADRVGYGAANSITGQINRDRLNARLFKTRQEGLPAPSAMPSAMNQQNSHLVLFV
jgi:hypothetical protein